MQRRDMLGALGLGVTAAALTGRNVRAAVQEHDIHTHDEHITVMESCAKFCNEAAHHCLEQLRKGQGNADYHARSHETLVACQEFCHLSATLMARHNPLSAIAHEANAKACETCAKVCSESDAKIMKDCAESCRKCAEVCRTMAKDGHHHGHH